jgi:ribosomal protein L37AE/L43A
MSQFPPCPRCGTNRKVNRHGQDQYFCGRCSGIFDDDPDEGGTHSTFNPAARLEREDRRQQGFQRKGRT